MQNEIALSNSKKNNDKDTGYIETDHRSFFRKLGEMHDKCFESGLLIVTILSAIVLVFIFVFIYVKASAVLHASGFSFLTRGGFSEQVSNAFNSEDGNSSYIFGGAGLIFGTLLSTLGALVIAIPMGVGTAIVICEFAPKWLKEFLSSVVRLLACIPSIIYGLIGLMVVVPFIKDGFITKEMQIKYLSDPILRMQLDGRCLLAGIVVLSIMILPIITILSVDAIKAVPKLYKDAAFALGFSHWRVIWKVMLPAARSGIMAGIILAVGRGTGEAIALSMVTGGISNIPQISHGGVAFLTPVLTLASAIVNKSEAMAVRSIESALFTCAVTLLFTSIILSLSTKFVETAVSRKDGTV